MGKGLSRVDETMASIERATKDLEQVMKDVHTITERTARGEGEVIFPGIVWRGLDGALERLAEDSRGGKVSRNAVKVSAVDTRTFLEVSIMAPPNCPQREMTATVLRKLDYMRARQAGRPGPRK